MDDEDDLNVIYSQSSTGSQTVQCTASMTRDFLKPFLELARNKINEIREEKAKQERIKKEKEHLKNLRKLKKLSKAQKEIQKAQVEKEKTQKKMSGVQEGKKKKLDKEIALEQSRPSNDSTIHFNASENLIKLTRRVDRIEHTLTLIADKIDAVLGGQLNITIPEIPSNELEE